MLKVFQDHIKTNFNFLEDKKILLAISGGLDSVVLTDLCFKSDLNIALAHCNFNLRGEESDEDEAFVSDLAERLNLELFIQNFDTNDYAESHKISIQMAARELRYDWFENLSEQLKFDYILTAHHADDQLETFLINLSRGTGLEGLTGIPDTNQNIIRPLLKFPREDLETYAKDNQIKWREDSSNASLKYLRNQIRHQVIPALKGTNPQFLQNFQKTQEHLKASNQIIDDAVNIAANTIITYDSDIIKFDIKALKELSSAKVYLYEFLKEYNFTAWNDINNLLDAQSGKQIFSTTHKLLKDRDYLLLSENKTNQNDFIYPVLIESKSIEIPLGILHFTVVESITDQNINTIYVDKDLLKYPLTVRHWKKGDYFYPLGMQGKKKLSKFFKDEKLTLLEKEQILILFSGDDIVWVLNKRGDDRFKIKETTNRILKIKVK